MWKIRVYICNDGDFYCEDLEFNTPLEETKEYYFENRNDAIKSLINSFHSVSKTCNVINKGYEEIGKWLRDWDRKIELICQKIESFSVGYSCGNHMIEYELSKINVEKHENYYTYKNDYKNFVYLNHYNVDEICWSDIENLKNI